MSRISVRNTLGDIFSTYSKNFFTLAPFGITLGLLGSLLQNFQKIINHYFLSAQDIPTADTLVKEAATTNSIIGAIASQIKQQSVFLHNTHRLDYTFFSITAFIVLSVVYYYAYFSFFKMLINLQKNQHPSLKTLFTYDCSVFKAITTSLLSIVLIAGVAGLSIGLLSGVYFLLQSFFNISSLAVSYKIMIPIVVLLVSTVLMVIFYATLRFNFAIPLVLDKNIGIKDAFKKSWHLTKGSTFKISIIYSLAVLLFLVFALCLTTIFLMVFNFSVTSPIFIVLYALINGIITHSLMPLTFTKTYQKLSETN